MSSLRELLKHSLQQHQQLFDRIAAVERRLPILDLESTVQATHDLDHLFLEIQNTDQEIIATLHSVDTDLFSDLLEKRLEMGRNVVGQYQKITPKLQTRLAGYKTELFKIKHGLQTMSGYTQSSSQTGRLINTSN